MAGVIGDSLKQAFLSLFRGGVAGIDYYTLYRATVVGQSGDRLTLDLEPSDPRLPGMQRVPLKLGIPGTTVEVKSGCAVQVGWEGADPQRPYACLWDSGAEVPVMTIKAAKIELGGEGLNPALDGVVRASTPCMFTGAPHLAAGKTSFVVLAKETP